MRCTWVHNDRYLRLSSTSSRRISLPERMTSARIYVGETALFWVFFDNIRQHKNTESKCNVGVWDDHDSHLANSQLVSLRQGMSDAFLNFLGGYQTVRRPHKERGLSASYEFHLQNRTVLLVLLDVRWRQSSPDVHTDVVGQTQFEWLHKQFDRAVENDSYVVLASSLQILADTKTEVVPLFESWGSFESANAESPKQRLLSMLLPLRGRIALISGDVHIAEAHTACLGEDEVVTEVTSSGLTHTWRTHFADMLAYLPFGRQTVARWCAHTLNWILRSPLQVQASTVPNFGLLRFSLENKSLRARAEVYASESETATPLWSVSLTAGKQTCVLQDSHQHPFVMRILRHITHVAVIVLLWARPHPTAAFLGVTVLLSCLAALLYRVWRRRKHHVNVDVLSGDEHEVLPLLDLD
ncbi:MAG: hypothetical protein MHM6MM_002933 [Cercozoa sp. M6MM]